MAVDPLVHIFPQLKELDITSLDTKFSVISQTFFLHCLLWSVLDLVFLWTHSTGNYGAKKRSFGALHLLEVYLALQPPHVGCGTCLKKEPCEMTL